MTDLPPAALRAGRVKRGSLVAALVGVALCALAWVLGPVTFLQSYLTAYLYWWTLGVGCLGIALLAYLVGGEWARAAKPFLEAGIVTLPLLALLFIPIALGMETLYEWTHEEVVEADPLIQKKVAYLNKPFFLGRAVGYFVIWLLLGLLALRWSVPPETMPEWPQPLRLRRLSAGGLVVLFTTVTFAAFDWGMSLDPHWYSSIYGALIAIGGGMAAFAVAIVGLGAFGDSPRVAATRTPKVLIDIGNLQMAFVVLWAYFSFSQFFIIWSGNLPHETVWYVERFEGSWRYVPLLLVFLHFFVPFLLLLSRDVKQNPRAISGVALWLLAIHYVDLFWATRPAFRDHDEGVSVYWADPVTVLAIGGLCVAVYARDIEKRFSQERSETPPAERPDSGEEPRHG